MIVAGVDISPVLALDADARLLVIWELEKSIEAENEAFELTEEMKTELDRRLAEYRADPSIGIPWEEVQAAAAQRRLAKQAE